LRCSRSSGTACSAVSIGGSCAGSAGLHGQYLQLRYLAHVMARVLLWLLLWLLLLAALCMLRLLLLMAWLLLVIWS